MSAPASANSAMKASGFSIIRWQSSGSLVTARSALTMGGPKVIFGTKWPSITSTCTIVPPPRSAAATSSARCAKSEASIENASSIKRFAPACEFISALLELLCSLADNRHNSLHVCSALVQNPHLGFFRGLALCLCHGLGIADHHAGSPAQNAPHRPAPIRIGKEDLAHALLLRSVVPASQQREMVAQDGQIVRRTGLRFQSLKHRLCPLLG